MSTPNQGPDNTQQGDFNLPSPLHQGKENFVQTEIPPTSRINYITGVYALNIPDKEATTGDWHDDVFWHPVAVRKPEDISLGGKGEFDTNHIFDDMGVQQARKRLVRIGLHVPDSIKKVYVANHIRAALDLAFYELNHDGRPTSVRGASSDWLDTEKQKRKLLMHAERLGDFLVGTQVEELEKWIAYERTLD